MYPISIDASDFLLSCKELQNPTGGINLSHSHLTGNVKVTINTRYYPKQKEKENLIPVIVNYVDLNLKYCNSNLIRSETLKALNNLKANHYNYYDSNSAHPLDQIIQKVKQIENLTKEAIKDKINNHKANEVSFIVCADGEVQAHTTSLRVSAWMDVMINSKQNNEDKKIYLTSFSARTVKTLVNFLQENEADKTLELSDCLNLWGLADYLNLNDIKEEMYISLDKMICEDSSRSIDAIIYLYNQFFSKLESESKNETEQKGAPVVPPPIELIGFLFDSSRYTYLVENLKKFVEEKQHLSLESTILDKLQSFCEVLTKASRLNDEIAKTELALFTEQLRLFKLEHLFSIEKLNLEETYIQAQSKYPKAQAALGLYRFKKATTLGQISKAIALISDVATKNCFTAILYLVRIYEHGSKFFPPQLDQHFSWLKKGVIFSGPRIFYFNRSLAYQAAKLYDQGSVEEQNLPLANWYLSLSATCNYEKALCALGSNEIEGFGIQQDNETGVLLLEKAEKLGSIRAMVLLGKYYSRFQTIEYYKKAFSLFLKAANLGDSVAQYEVGKFYARGYIEQKSALLATDWMEKAAKNQNISAAIWLADTYFRGREEILANFEKSASRWFILDPTQLSSSENRQRFEALKELSNKKISNVSGVLSAIAYCYHYGFGTNQNSQKAIEYYLKTGIAGNPIGYLSLSSCFQFGMPGIEPNPSLAQEYFTMAQDFEEEQSAENDTVEPRIKKAKIESCSTSTCS